MMPTTGKVKFMERSKTLLSDGARIEFLRSQGNLTPLPNDSLNNLLSFDRDNYFQVTTGRSTGLDKIVFSIIFSSPATFNRIILVDTNIAGITMDIPGSTKALDIDNDPIDFSFGRVLSDSRKENLKTLYYELETPITASVINEIHLNFISDNTRFYARQLIVTNEIGTLEGFPTVSAYTESNNEIVNLSLIHI